MRRCPYCDEEVRDNAIKCKHCGSLLTRQGINIPDKVVSLHGQSRSKYDTLDVAATQGRDATILAGQYRIIKKIGEGGMGIVYLAEDMEMGNRQVAIKVLPPLLSRNIRSVNNLRKEAITAINLNHPNIVILYGFHSDGDIKFLVMEYIDGQTLEDKIIHSEQGKLTLDEILPIAEQIAAALDYVHHQNPPVFHRDLKPSNIMIDKRGQVKILDFGIAREMRDCYTRVTGQETSGTIPYMSPQQINGDPPTARMDIYSFAVTVYECMAGHTPFYTGDIKYQILNQCPNEIVDVPRHANKALQIALAKNAEDRPPTTKDFIQMLKKTQVTADKVDRKLPKAQKIEKAGITKDSKIFDCPHCNAVGVTAMSDGRCPNCKRKPSDSGKKLVTKQSDLSISHKDKKSQRQVVLIGIGVGTFWILMSILFGIYKIIPINLAVTSPPTPFLAIQLLFYSSIHDLTNLIVHLIILYIIVKIAKIHLSPAGFIYLYFMGSIGGGLIFVLVSLLIDKPASLICSGMILTTYLGALTTRAPKYPVVSLGFIRIKLFWITAFYVGFPILAFVSQLIDEQAQDTVALNVSMLAGFVLGVVYTLTERTIDLLQNNPRYLSRLVKRTVRFSVFVAINLLVIITVIYVLFNIFSSRRKNNAIVNELPQTQKQPAKTVNPSPQQVDRREVTSNKPSYPHESKQDTIAENNIKGVITDIDLENSLAEISIGSVNGVKEGMWFHVFRGEKFICNIVILDVESEKAVGTLDLIDITQEQPKAGDTVQTELSLSQQAAKRDVINKMQSSSLQSEHVDVLTNSIGMRLVYIPKGEFMMGSPSSKEERYGNEGPQHWVRISKGFYMSQTEVTQGQYKSVMNTQPWSGESYVQESDSNPAVYVSWNDAVEFCRKLSQQEGKTYRLPTEAEWEYACRAGTTTCFSFGDSDSSLGDYAWFCGNAWDVDQKYAHRVGQKKPNRWNLYDMHGNVFEWCNDWYDRNYYSNSPVFDPQGPASGSSRVVRGGSWYNTPTYCRSEYRGWKTPGYQYNVYGFRVVLETEVTISGAVSSSPKLTNRETRSEMPSGSVQSQKYEIVTNSVGMKLVNIPSGEFMMGSPRDEENRSSDEDKHRVIISRDFYMGQTEVTQSQYRAVMGNEPWLGQSYMQQSNNNPAAYISWDEAEEFCKRLTQKEGRTYKLPTEAQWEYACRAGTTTRYSFGDSESSLGEYAWFYGNAGNIDEKYAHLVAQKKMNAFNLYDMHGNVWEWCRDWYKSNYYEDSPNIDPEGPNTGSSRVLRGGCWNNGPGSCRSSIRRGNTPNYKSGYIGFRVVMEIEK